MLCCEARGAGLWTQSTLKGTGKKCDCRIKYQTLQAKRSWVLLLKGSSVPKLGYFTLRGLVQECQRTETA